MRRLRCACRLLEEPADGRPSRFCAAQVLRAQALLVAAAARRRSSCCSRSLRRRRSACRWPSSWAGRRRSSASCPRRSSPIRPPPGAQRAPPTGPGPISDRAREIVQQSFLRGLARPVAGRLPPGTSPGWSATGRTPRRRSSSAMEMARAPGDARGELAAVKALLASRPEDSALALRRGQLELLGRRCADRSGAHRSARRRGALRIRCCRPSSRAPSSPGGC